MKPKSKPKTAKEKAIAIYLASSLGVKKTRYSKASVAIQKKLEEIKKESKMPAAINNNVSLFRYKV